MPQQTPILNLTLFDGIEDKPESFLSYRVAMAGTEPSSNFNKIDVAIGQLQENSESYTDAIKGITGENDVETEPAISLKDANTSINEIDDDLSSLAEDFVNHLNAAMPHLMTDHKTGKVYRYGERISAEGKPQIIYEEVI